MDFGCYNGKMTDIVTAPLEQSYGDFGYADQEGEELDSKTVFFCLKHPPWVCPSLKAESTLKGLEPPRKLTRDWNKTIINNTVPETWEKINYEERYRKHLETNKRARNDLYRISTLSKHQEVCLLCQDLFYQFCIRRIIYEYLQENGGVIK